MSTSPSSSSGFGGSCRFACQVLLRVSERLRFLSRRHDCSCLTTKLVRVDGDGDGDEGEDGDGDEGEGEGEDKDEDEDEEEDAHEHREGLEHEGHRIGAELTGEQRFPRVCEAILEI